MDINLAFLSPLTLNRLIKPANYNNYQWAVKRHDLGIYQLSTFVFFLMRKKKCLETESNRWRIDLQSIALPTELSRQNIKARIGV